MLLVLLAEEFGVQESLGRNISTKRHPLAVPSGVEEGRRDLRIFVPLQ